MRQTGKGTAPDINNKGKYAFGFDLGGTKTAVGLVDKQGIVLFSRQMPTPLSSGPKTVCWKMKEMCLQIMAEAEISPQEVIGIGIGAGGPLDLDNGTLLSPPNLPGFNAFPLRAEIEKTTGMKVFLDNDANAAALGEKMFGAGRKADNLLYLTVSTGIGCGLILDGRLFHGFRWSAGEVGHMTLRPDGPKCNCGNRGCLEALSSGTGIAKLARKAVLKQRNSLILKLADDKIKKIDAEMVFRAEKLGDETAKVIVEEALMYLGIGIGNLITAFAPDMVILGGGLTRAGNRLFSRVRRTVRKRVKLVPVDLVPIVPAMLGEKVGIVGAASLVLKLTGS